MSITVFAHIRPDTEVAVRLLECETGKYVALEAGDLTVFTHDREKLLGLASLLEQAAQKWGGGEE